MCLGWGQLQVTSVVDSEVYSREDSDWQGTGSSVPELPPWGCAGDPFSCCLLDLEALGARSSGPSEVLLGGCVGMVAPLGDGMTWGAWLEEVLGRSTAEPEDSRAGWGRPEEVTDDRACGWLAARGGWLEELSRGRGGPRDLPGNWEALAGERSGDWLCEELPGAGLLGDEGLVADSTRE